ncbi:hypothetical protein EES39_38185 [Streptomyces sp. ADI92-24]|uniref:hypothetical protein n=1 Tax=Streptomyces sp. ADI92-24 TaxID=1522756 RepID=UPI000F54D6F6|nr:hypothetical protein [Streptomyces sp. ADI92-24]RPK32632.1 hypothetical protein EES39_38185 [Streptomyces sp. ADI92-24]
MMVEESPGRLAEWVRADIREARTALSRARLLHGERSPAYRLAAASWSHRQAVLDELAARRGVGREDLDLSGTPALQLLAAVRKVRLDVAAADCDSEFLAATAFLGTSSAAEGSPG